MVCDIICVESEEEITCQVTTANIQKKCENRQRCTLGVVRSYQYDLLGRLTNVNDAENQNTIYCCDAASRLISQAYRNGLTVKNWDDPRAASKSGDSMLYKGAGGLHLTWKIHYYAFARDMENKFSATYNGKSVFDYIIDSGADAIAKDFAWESAGWAWHYNLVPNVGSPAKNYREGVLKGDSDYNILTAITYSINGGLTNINNRWKYFGYIREVIV